MSWLLIGLAFFLGGFIGVVAMAFAAAAKDADDFWRGYERGEAQALEDLTHQVRIINPN